MTTGILNIAKLYDLLTEVFLPVKKMVYTKNFNANIAIMSPSDFLLLVSPHLERPRFFIKLFFIFSCLYLCAPSFASTSEKKIVVVGVEDCDDLTLPTYVKAVREALAGRLKSAVLSEKDPRLVDKSTVNRIIDDIKTDMISIMDSPEGPELQKKIRSVKEKFQQAENIILSLYPSSEHSDILLRIKELELEFAIKINEEVEHFLERFFRVLPDFIFDPNVYDPDNFERYEKIRKKIKEEFTATLKITSQPAGLPVYVDGYKQPRPSPITLKFPPGEYQVWAAVGDNRGMTHSVLLTNNMVTQVDIEKEFEASLHRTNGLCVAKSNFEERSRMLAKLALAMKVNTVIGVHSKHSDQDSHLDVEVVDVTTGAKKNKVAIKLENGKLTAVGVDYILAVLNNSKNFLIPNPPSPPPPSWIRTGAYVSGILACGLAGLTTYEGFSARNYYHRASSMVNQDRIIESVNNDHNSMIKKGDSARKAAFIFGGTTMLFTGAAIVLGYMSKEPEPFVFRF